MNEKRDNAADLANRSFRTGRLRDMAILLPIVGIVVYLTPVLRIFTAQGTVFGVPLVFVFIYGGWVLLIVLSRILGHRLRDTPEL